MDIHQHNSTTHLPRLLDELAASLDTVWGIVWVNKKYLKPMTFEALAMALRPALGEASVAHVFLDGEAQLFIVWKGDPQKTYKQLRGLITSALTQCDSTIRPLAIVGYINPLTDAAKLKEALKSDFKKDDKDGKAQARLIADLIAPEEAFNFEDTDASSLGHAAGSLTQTPEQISHYNKLRSEKPYRKQLHILVAEDSSFSQKLLAEIIRGIRNQIGESPLTDIVPGMQEAWGLFLKKAPDVCFIDLRLLDGSGHALVRAMKEIDPSCYVVVVTANGYEEEQAVARQNNVDGFIVKPYTKKQILECIDKYKTMKPSPRRG